MPLLGHIDLNTGVRIRKPKPVRYERSNPGDLVHVDVKKLGRIPDGGGHCTLGRAKGRKNRSRVGYASLHSAIDDHSRIAYSEILENEKIETAAGFWERANAFCADLGITVTRVMTDNGSCNRSKLFNGTLGEQVSHKYTRHYRPQTNGKTSASTANSRPSRPTPTTRTQRPFARPHTRNGSITTIITDPIPASEASHPSNVSITSMGRTPRSSSWSR